VVVDELGNQVQDATQPTSAGAAQRQAAEEEGPRALSARKPGVVGRFLNTCRNLVAGIAAPRWDLRTFLYGLIALLILVLFIHNWAPVRIDLLGWKFQLPMPVFFLINLALGALLLRLWQIYGPDGHEETQ